MNALAQALPHVPAPSRARSPEERLAAAPVATADAPRRAATRLFGRDSRASRRLRRAWWCLWRRA